MKRRRVVYLPSAQRDMLEAFEYVRKDSPAAAAEWLRRIDAALGRLSSFPFSGSVPKDRRLAARGYRMVVIDEHLAFYIVRPRAVEVRRVLHGKRRYEFLLRPSKPRPRGPC
ncbi:MAG TPA: type II toxin-antitoxin system RelE/ParE family toxin [Elusimicrobiota bacterium]|nr:type II toxin-antitoxin system RelE/ParE family toxin [Elusimicrobiota bacterium]